ncbi:MAG: helix-turn-helix transcriptional regulator [Erysipelotrichaceae bacterium]|nr:helix-turn-helix transcriptional regulator [Erysipelotrichaceae bacterium]
MGFKIKEAREEKGITQEELSNKSGVSRNLISRLESGDLKSTSTNTLIKIANALEKSVNDIFFGDNV